MKPWTLTLLAVATAGAVTLASAEAEAQRVRTFGDDDVDEQQAATVHIPGAPAPDQQPPSAEQSPSGDDEQEGSQQWDAGAYQISLHGGQSGHQRQKRAAEFLSRDDTELYRGVIPGKRDEVEHLSELKRRAQSSADPNPITWIGFQPEDDKTRVFIQAPRPVEYRLRDASEGNDLILIFRNATIPKRNFSRFIDTTHFDRIVQRIEATERSGATVEVTLSMRDKATPQLSTEGGYLYIDFAHGGGEDE